MHPRAIVFAIKQSTERVGKSISDFAWAPASPAPLAAFRIGVCCVLLVQAFSLAPSIRDLYGEHALIQPSLASYLGDPLLPKMSFLTRTFTKIGLSEWQVVISTGVAYVFALIALLLGWQTRFAATFAWLLHMVLTNSAPCANYGVDIFSHIALFYLVWMPAGQSWSIDAWGKQNTVGTPETRLAIRVLQIHLCIVYLTSGIEKAMGEQWQNGEVIWRSLMLPVYSQFDMSWISNFPTFCKFAAWGTLVVEIGYCVFIWPKRTRTFWVASIVGLHVGIGVFLGLGLFSAMMCVFTICAFGISSNPAPAVAQGTRPTFARLVGYAAR